MTPPSTDDDVHETLRSRASMTVAIVQMTSGGDRAVNVARAGGFVGEAAAAGADLVLLPEFFNTVYFAQYWDVTQFGLAEPESGPTLSAMRECARRHRLRLVATIYELAGPGLYYDTAFLIDRDGEVRLRYRKTHPAGVKSLEKIYFRGGTAFPVARLDDWRVGVGICYDMAFPETARSLAVNGAELLLAPYATSRVNMFQEMLRTRAFENGCFLAAANKVGREGDWTFPGGSLVAGPDGAVLASMPEGREGMVTAEIDRARVFEARTRYPTWRDRRPDLYGALTRTSEDDGGEAGRES